MYPLVMVCVHQAKCWLRIKGPFPSVFTESVWCRITTWRIWSTSPIPVLPPRPTFFSLLQLINPPVFPSTESSPLHNLVSVCISHLSSKILLLFLLLWTGLVQSKSASAGDRLPTNKANHSDIKGQSLGRTKSSLCMCTCVLCTVHACTFVCLLAFV